MTPRVAPKHERSVRKPAPKESTKPRGPLDWIDDLNPTLCRADVARYAGCTTRHVDRAIASGALLTLRHGDRRVVVLRDSFKRWLTASLSGVSA